MASGGENLLVVKDGDKWFRGTENNAAKIPGQIAAKMKGMKFRNFDQFRETFWKLVAKDKGLSKRFSEENIILMKEGLAPRVQGAQSSGNVHKYIIHHKTPIYDGGSVYDMDNLVLVTPKMHDVILDPGYHYGTK